MNKHPYLNVVEATCSTCGATHVVRSAAGRLSVDTCSNCHPAYTGVERAASSGTRVERFNRRASLAAA
jgi:large subunit ribosomal protein L31